VPGTENNGQPFFWSPDSRFIAYGGRGKLLKVEVAGGPPQKICDAPNGVIGGTWSKNGVILFGQTAGGLMRVSEGGGIASPVTALDAAKSGNKSCSSSVPAGRTAFHLPNRLWQRLPWIAGRQGTGRKTASGFSCSGGLGTIGVFVERAHSLHAGRNAAGPAFRSQSPGAERRPHPHC
jgi:hypothetical protein